MWIALPTPALGVHGDRAVVVDRSFLRDADGQVSAEALAVLDGVRHVGVRTLLLADADPDLGFDDVVDHVPDRVHVSAFISADDRRDIVLVDRKFGSVREELLRRSLWRSPGYIWARSPLPLTSRFTSGDYVSRARRVPDDEYGRALDSIVKTCVDLLVIDDETDLVLLGKRRVFPHKDWWVGCGGRALAGESVVNAALRLLKRELSITGVPQQRFCTITHFTFLWDRREQPPKENGTADTSILVAVRLDRQQIQGIQLDAAEYSAMKWVTFSMLANNKQKAYHPALQRVACEYMALRHRLHIESACRDAPVCAETDAYIAKQMRAYTKFVDLHCQHADMTWKYT
ncbi:Nudix hydrolase domain-containing protein [Plasmodiophora brassicae]|uniref:Nudix hydrolase domain-containing protein n=1 Tax=Plasmodiophora brassicae TaxID=37360 RepID=A0A0G4IUV2_PLABS|nr:hypothetical protein PBRA_007174 [Plasmodiophora brassicae]SPQ98615.1 unnamed protein product [Plasmodiophora brassicae]